MPLDLFVCRELERKIYRGQKISIIRELKARLITAANGASCSTDSVPEQQAPSKRLQTCVAAHGTRFE